ncbi:MAG: aldo/keto reductase [Alphaproteobacteria bacterium]|nr:aldo/keto reductase [Alphaproteobacteria bacterium]
MKQRRLGQNGPMVGEVGLGAMSFGGIFGPTDKATSHRALDKALDVGMTHIDTALIYGPFVSEEVIGEYLAKSPAARKAFSIATKGGINPNPRGVSNTAGFMRECLESSLRRLGVERVDLYYVHRREHAIPIEDVMGTMAQFVKEGKIGGIGLSEISPATLERASKIHPVAAVQNEYSLWTRLPELGLTQLCKKLGTTLVAFSPVGRGVLTDVVIDTEKLPASDFRKGIPRFQAPNFALNMQRVEMFKAYAKARGWTPASLANAWVLAQGEHIIPIPGTRTAEHLADNASASAIKLSAKDLAEIEDIMPLGSAHGNRYSHEQQGAAEQYC